MMLRYNHTSAHTLTGTQFVHEWVHHLSAQGHAIIDASRGKPSYPVDAAIWRAMQDAIAGAQQDVFPYGTDALGEPEYREAVAIALSDWYASAIDPAQIVFTPGGQFALNLSFTLLHKREPEGVFVSTAPGYLNYAELVRYVCGSAESLSPVILQSSRQYRFTATDLDAHLRTLSRPIAGFVFCNPLNPTGQVISQAEWQDFATLLREYDAPILLDEAFTEVAFKREPSLLQVAPDLRERMFLFRSGTKAHGLPGERLAVSVVPPQWIEAFRFHQSRVLGNPPLLAQAGMTAALTHLTPARLSDLRQYYQANATKLQQRLRQIPAIQQVIVPEGGFFLLAQMSAMMGGTIPPAAREAMGIANAHITTDEELMAALLFAGVSSQKAGVALMPGSYFGLEAGAGIMRISFSMAPAEIDQLLEALAEICCA